MKHPADYLNSHFANTFFKVYNVHELMKDTLFCKILELLGIHVEDDLFPDTTVPWPFQELQLDSYDLSIELLDTTPGTQFSPEALAYLWNLGFSRIYLNYNDGSERHYSKSFIHL